jgi:Domain of unknown function (DUF4178)
MAIVVAFLLGALAFMVVAAVVFAATRAKHAVPVIPRTAVDPLAPIPAGYGHPSTLQVGDLVGYKGADYVVRERVDFTERGFSWFELLLDDTRDRFWLEVENDDGELLLTRWDTLDVSTAVGITTNTLAFGEKSVRLTESGQAQFRSNGLTGLALSGTMKYRTFRDGELLISVDQWADDTWEGSTGSRIENFAITVMTRPR